jgi:group II intron reverse transcriptase/maturase
MQTSIHVIANAARRDKNKRFRSLYSLFNRVLLEEAFRKLNKKSVSGVDKVTWKEYESNLEANLIDLEERLKQKRYWPRYVKRVFIPKPNGKKRPLGILVLEDKIVQQLASDILMALFEPVFLDCSYAYRPNRSAKKAVSDLREEIKQKYVWVVEADIKGFFDHIDHSWLLRMVEKRVNDRAFIGLISRFLKSGISMPDGTIKHPECGTPQGGVVSPVLANIYLHYVLDLWFDKKVKTQGQGQALLIRYADDFVAAFRYHGDAARFYRELGPRFAKFGLELAKDKTRKLQFNRFKKDRSETFVFLSYEFRQTVSRIRGNDIVSTVMSRKKLHQTVDVFSQWCKDNRNRRIAGIMGDVKAKLTGIRNYFNLPGNYHRMREVKLLFRRKLFFWLNRRSERKSYNWKTFSVMWNQFLEKKPRSLANEGVQTNFLLGLV